MSRDLLYGISKTKRERFYNLIDKGSDDECWGWRGPVSGAGKNHPYISHTPPGEKPRNVSVSQVLYDEIIGLPEKGEHFRLSSTCGTGGMCVNPHHKRVALRKFKKKRAQRTHCDKGHYLEAPKARDKDGACLICKRETDRAYKQRLKENDPEKYKKFWGKKEYSEEEITKSAMELLEQF